MRNDSKTDGLHSRDAVTARTPAHALKGQAQPPTQKEAENQKLA